MFLSYYHNRYYRNINDELVAYVQALLPKLTRMPKAVNMLMSNPISCNALHVDYIDAYIESKFLYLSAKESWFNEKEVNHLGMLL